MTNKQTTLRFATAAAVAALLFNVATGYARNDAPTSQTFVAESDPDFLVLNPEGE